jgi:hypothetical protein
MIVLTLLRGNALIVAPDDEFEQVVTENFKNLKFLD